MNQLANNVLDGQPSTLWTTVCYASRYMGGKKGVGLVADLGPRLHSVDVNPFVLRAKGGVALDALVVLAPPRKS